jgi:WD40 repeat protein
MNRRAILAWLLAAALLPSQALAEHTRYWTQTDFSDFDKGSAEGVALRSDGKLMPAPKFAQFSDPNLTFLWALRADSHGRLYAAGGSNAKVLRIDDAGNATPFFESAELAAQAIAFDSHDNLYVGTSPDGRVYKVASDGTKSVFFDPQRKYIWALAFEPNGNLFVATGDQGEVFVVGPDGKGQRFYQSHERHARSIAFDAKGNLLIGTEPDGLILRIEVARKSATALPAAGASFVVYETSKAEVTSLAVSPNGTLYAAAGGDKSRNSEAPRLAVPSISPNSQTLGQGGATQGGGNIIIGPASGNNTQQSSISFGFPTASPRRGSEIVKIAPDGSPETVWTSQDDLVYNIALLPDGRALLGTGDSGTVIQLDGDRIYSRIAQTSAGQVTSLAVGAGGKVFLATANPGKIFVLGPGFASEGTFTSDVFDAKIFSHWGRLSWYGANGSGQDNVRFYVRSGNTANPEDNWSAWAGPYNTSATAAVEAPAARFAQWKAVFQSSADAVNVPDISWVSLAYQPKNVPPVIDDVVVQSPGVRAVGFAAQPSGPGNPASAPLRMPRDPASSIVTVMGGDNSSGRVDVPPQGYAEKGYESILWSAHDDNGDDLAFAIYYRGESERNWRLLKDKITQHFYSWDTSTMPDGAYYLKVVASDAPSNPPDQALDTERESDRWEVANTPPRIENLRAGAAAPNTKVSFDATSSSGAIAHAKYSVDAGDWKIVFPAGLLSDAPKESYSFDLSGLSPGEHTLAVQVSDRFDNMTSGKVTFTVPLHPSQ